MNTYIPIPQKLYNQLYRIAEIEKQPVDTVLVNVLQHGLESIQEKTKRKTILERLADLHITGGPADLSVNHDHYLYGGPKKQG